MFPLSTLLLQANHTPGFLLSIPPYIWVRRTIEILLFVSMVLIVERLMRGKRLRVKGLLCLLGIIVYFGVAAAIRLPVENLFVTHSSVQGAFNYTRDGVIADSLDGEDSTLVIYPYRIVYDEHELIGYLYDILPRTEKGWKMANPRNRIDEIKRHENTEFNSSAGKYSVTIVRREKLQGYYVIIKLHSSIAGEEGVVDNLESQFQMFIEPDGVYAGTVWWVTYLESLDENYEIFIDGEPVEFRSRFSNLTEWFESHKTGGVKGTVLLTTA
ncbi:MAG: hypothetical protein FWE69_05165 [Clostridiales bacterium]|nr:hypothetical protein [Clostridiales bacterium]